MEGSMSEEKTVVNESVEEVTTQSESQVQPESEGLIAESKKYRKRAQDAEARLVELESKFEQQENAKLKEKEEWKTLSEKLQSQLDEVSPYKDKHEKMVSDRKESLLSLIPEDQREKFKNKDLETIEFIVSQMPSKSETPAARGSVKTNAKPIDIKEFKGMSKQEKQSKWAAFMNQYKK